MKSDESEIRSTPDLEEKARDFIAGLILPRNIKPQYLELYREILEIDD